MANGLRMLFNLFLIILLAGSAGVLWRRISEKIPELIAIPDEVIVARLHEDSARVRIFLLHARTFWREPRYREPFWRFCEKICYRVHIIFLRMDNGLMTLAKKARGYAGIASAEGAENAAFAAGEEIRAAVFEEANAAAEPPQVTLASMDVSPRSAPARVQEVRKRSRKISPSA